MNYVHMTFAYMPSVNALGTDCCIIQHMHVALSSRYVANFSQYRAPCVEDPQLAIYLPRFGVKDVLFTNVSILAFLSVHCGENEQTELAAYESLGNVPVELLPCLEWT